MSKVRTGVVVSNKGDKTAIVKIDRMVPHERYDKRYRVSKRFAVHDASNQANVGDTVIIEETRPISKTKQWKIVTLVTTHSIEAKPLVVAPKSKAKPKTKSKARAGK